MLTTAEKIRVILRRKGITITDLANATGQTRQNLTNKFSRDNLTENDMKAIANALGCDLQINFVDRRSGEIME